MREDYFGLGANNASLFSIPIDVPDGTGPNHGAFGTLGQKYLSRACAAEFRYGPDQGHSHRKSGAEAKLASIQFRAEFFNVFNIVNFGLPSNILLGPGFGEISRTAGTSRQIQFSLKLIY